MTNPEFGSVLRIVFI